MGHYFEAQPAVGSEPVDVEVCVGGGTFSMTTDRGVFSYGRLDRGTGLLLRDAPPGAGRSNSAQRLQAVRGAFAVPPGAARDGATVLLVDDRTDTGWTLTEAARVVREAGAATVLPLVLAVDA